MNLKDAQTLALELMREHGLGGSGWKIGFDGARKRFGLCDYGRKRISLSQHLVELNSEAEVKETILHEIAHVLTPKDQAHGIAWQAVARAIGCTGNRCYDHDQVVLPDVQRRKRWLGICPTCGKQHERARLPMSRGIRTSASCGSCSTNGYDPRFKLEWYDQFQ